MKKLLLFAVVLGAVSFTSCKKDYDCTCTASGAGVSTSSTTTLKDLTKSEAEDACNSETTVFGITTKCELD